MEFVGFMLFIIAVTLGVIAGGLLEISAILRNKLK